jgi:hypothetical protein
MAGRQSPSAWPVDLPRLRHPRLPDVLGPIGRSVPRVRRVRRCDIHAAADVSPSPRAGGRWRADRVPSPGATARTRGCCCGCGGGDPGRGRDRVRIRPRGPDGADRSGRRHRGQAGRRDRSVESPRLRHTGCTSHGGWRPSGRGWNRLDGRDERAAIRWIDARTPGPDAHELAPTSNRLRAGPDPTAEAHAEPDRDLPPGRSQADGRAAQRWAGHLEPGRVQRSGDRRRRTWELPDRDPVPDTRPRVRM